MYNIKSAVLNDLIFNVHAKEITSSADPFDDGLSLFRNVSALKGVRVFFNTTQPSSDAIMGTLEWLKGLGVSQATNVIIFNNKPKMAGYVGYLIDDKPANIIRDCDFLLARPWNVGSNIKRYSCIDIYKMIEDIVNIKKGKAL